MSGASKGSKSALMLTVGTGIGGSMVIGGEVYHGCSGSACEVGYMHMEGSDFQHLERAHFDTESSGVEKRAGREAEWLNTFSREAKKVYELCIRAIDEMADVLGRGLQIFVM